MRAYFEKVATDPNRSFRILEQRLPEFDAPWHFHPEIELTVIIDSRGRRFVGDSVEPFVEGDLVLLGPDLPHFWHNEGPQPAGSRAHAIVVQFLPNFLGPDLWTRAEFVAIGRLIARARRGLCFRGPSAHAATGHLRRLAKLDGLEALIELWRVLALLASTRSVRPLASAAYVPSLDAAQEARLARVYAFLLERYTSPVTLAEVADVAALTPAAFSRYFKRMTRHNMSDFLNDLRIAHAAQSLRDTAHSIARVAADAGFTTLSNFNRRFRARFGCTPRDYRRDSELHSEMPHARFQRLVDGRP